MREPLTKALRERNLAQARHIIFHLQERMGPEYVANVLWEAIEHLAWIEGDRPAGRWITKNSPLTLKKNLPLRH